MKSRTEREAELNDLHQTPEGSMEIRFIVKRLRGLQPGAAMRRGTTTGNTFKRS